MSNYIRKTEKNKILITGSRGFIGGNLVSELQKDKMNEVTEYVENLYNPMKFCNNFDVIYHLAANTDTTFPNDVEMYRNNIIGFLNILEFALRKKSKLIYASSAATYGINKKPLNAYGDSKRIIDEIAMKYKDILSIVGLKFFNVYGQGEEKKGKMSSMITQWKKQILSGHRPVIFEGNFKRDFVYVNDVVKALIEAQKLESGLYDVGSGKTVDFRTVLKIILKEFNSRLEPEFIPNPYLGKYQTYTKANLNWGFKPDFNIESGIRHYFKNY